MEKTYTEERTMYGNVTAANVHLSYNYTSIPGLISVKGLAGNKLADPMEAVGTPGTLLLLGEALVHFAKAEQARRAEQEPK